MNESSTRYLVGGAVRDRLLNLPVTERDWVVVGSTPEQMIASGFTPVGQDFPVFIDPRTGEEYALARTERKSGKGYGGFVFHTSPDVTLEQDLARRDLTINAMALDENGTLIDPYGGRQDLERRLLRHVSPAFVEDPLRVLRVARFAARFADLGFTIVEETRLLMRRLAASGELKALTAERSWKEVSRALMHRRPDVFIGVLHDCGALQSLIPELAERIAEPCADRPELDRLLGILRKAAELELGLAARWACLVQGLARPSGEQATERSDTAEVEAAGRRFKVPRDCQELASLSGRYLPLYQRAHELSAGDLLELFRAFDIYRRPERFEQFLAVCAAVCSGDGEEPHAATPRSYFLGAADMARGVAIQPLLARGFTGAALGEALQEERRNALERYRSQTSERGLA